MCWCRNVGKRGLRRLGCFPPQWLCVTIKRDGLISDFWYLVPHWYCLIIQISDQSPSMSDNINTKNILFFSGEGGSVYSFKHHKDTILKCSLKFKCKVVFSCLVLLSHPLKRKVVVYLFINRHCKWLILHSFQWHWTACSNFKWFSHPVPLSVIPYFSFSFSIPPVSDPKPQHKRVGHWDSPGSHQRLKTSGLPAQAVERRTINSQMAFEPRSSA